MLRNQSLHPNSAGAKAQCACCPKRGAGVVVSIRVTEKFETERRLLCQRCRQKLGFAAGYMRAPLTV